MSNKQYLPAFKVEVVLEVLREEKELGDIAAHYIKHYSWGRIIRIPVLTFGQKVWYRTR